MSPGWLRFYCGDSSLLSLRTPVVLYFYFCAAVGDTRPLGARAAWGEGLGVSTRPLRDLGRAASAPQRSSRAGSGRASALVGRFSILLLGFSLLLSSTVMTRSRSQTACKTRPGSPPVEPATHGSPASSRCLCLSIWKMEIINTPSTISEVTHSISSILAVALTFLTWLLF